jgi:hypothetical protein
MEACISSPRVKLKRAETFQTLTKMIIPKTTIKIVFVLIYTNNFENNLRILEFILQIVKIS